jgi:hypothetical protein
MFEFDPTPRAHMAMQTPESLNVSRYLKTKINWCWMLYFYITRARTPHVIVNGLNPQHQVIVQGTSPTGVQQHNLIDHQPVQYEVQGRPIPLTRREREAEEIWNSTLS